MTKTHPQQVCDFSLRREVERSISSLEAWVREREWKGYDPYDLRALLSVRIVDRLPLIGAIKKRLENAMLPKAVPILRTARVPEKRHAMAMGLFLASYTRLIQLELHQSFRDYAKLCADWLFENAQPGYSGLCWGLPFHWQSLRYFKKGTPFATTSVVAGYGLWEYYKLTHDKAYLDACSSICEFLSNDLNPIPCNDNAICFSYSPCDNFRVHNSNLMVAEFLALVGTYCHNQRYLDLANAAGNYALGDQNEDGSLYYWGVGDRRNMNRDIYHSGFEIRSLWNLGKLLNCTSYRDAALRYSRFFESAYVQSDGMILRHPPQQRGNRVVDIHGCAEAILCLSTLLPNNPEGIDRLESVARWTLAHMQNEDGSWAYQRCANGYIDRTPYIRWGQAWMLRALVEFVWVTGDYCMQVTNGRTPPNA